MIKRPNSGKNMKIIENNSNLPVDKDQYESNHNISNNETMISYDKKNNSSKSILNYLFK